MYLLLSLLLYRATQKQYTCFIRHKAVITRCNFSCTLSLSGVARPAAVGSQPVICPLCNLSCNSFGLTMIAQSNVPANCLATFKTKPIASCRRHVLGAITRCNLQSILRDLFKTNSMQSLQNVGLSSTLCNCCKP